MRENTRHFFELLSAMTEKELRARYKNTLFGFLWVVANPLLQMLVIGFIFPLFIKVQIENYFLYLLVGLLVWNFVSLSLAKATPSLVYERALIKKAKFPREVIPLSIILSNFIHLLVALVLLCVLLLFFGPLSITSLPWVFFGFSLLISLTTGLSLLAAALNVRYRDVNFFVQALLILWFYATPIVYSPDVIPYRLIWLWKINPLTSVVQFFQNAFVFAPLPHTDIILVNALLIMGVLFLGIWVFRSESKNFDDWL